MEKLFSINGFRYQKVPESFICPPEKVTREIKFITECKTFPMINLGGAELGGVDRDVMVKQIIQAGKEYSFFQVINHGVSEHVIDDMMTITEEFFKIPADDKASYHSDDPRKFSRHHSSSGAINEPIHGWRGRLRLTCSSVEEVMHLWPQKPSKI